MIYTPYTRRNKPAELPACRCGLKPRDPAPLWERLDEFGWLLLRVWSA